jgi:integrase/recombinase XerD
MFEQYIRLPRVLARIRASAFAPELEALVEYLQRRGHRGHAIAGYLLGAEHLADCIDKKLVSLDGLTADGLQQFARKRAMRLACGCPRKTPDRNLISVARHFFVVLREQGRCRSPATAPLPRSHVDTLLEQFDRHLRDERGLAGSTREAYLRTLRPVLATKYGGEVVDPSGITVQDLRRWVASRAAATSPRTARKLAQTLRSLLRFFVLHGEPVAHLVTAVPIVPTSRLSALPRGLSDPQLAQLTRSIDVSKPIGLRARAIVECAATLGLRAGEVAALRISDIDWRGGTIHLPRTKSRRGQVLPLPSAVGRVLVSYLKRGRPNSSTDRVFVRHYMPVGRALQSKDVTQTVGRALRRAGLQLPLMGAHVLRHTAASRLVRAGVGMKDIADVMRHQDIDTTRIYAKVDWPRLTEVALPWPTREKP